MSTFEDLAFYRGSKTDFSSDRLVIVEPIRNRRPLNSPQSHHQAADDWFDLNMGHRYRSNAVFLTSSHFTAAHYAGDSGIVARIVPITAYRYCWSPLVKDFIYLYANLKTSLSEAMDCAGYIETDLDRAFAMGNEVMLFCEKYVAIPESFLNIESPSSTNAAASSKIII